MQDEGFGAEALCPATVPATCLPPGAEVQGVFVWVTADGPRKAAGPERSAGVKEQLGR